MNLRRLLPTTGLLLALASVPTTLMNCGGAKPTEPQNPATSTGEAQAQSSPAESTATPAPASDKLGSAEPSGDKAEGASAATSEAKSHDEDWPQ